jgi:BMFP domain-containing protein YqiC
LLRTREQLDALQRTVAELEAQLGTAGAGTVKQQAPQQG